jgi:chemotaxis protein methyltransferase CheR
MQLAGYATFRRTVLDLTGVDLDCYKGTQMERRLQAYLRRCGIDGLLEFARILHQEPAKRKEFTTFLTINVSEWVRNPEKFTELEQVILPQLLSRSQSLRIWSAGCSNGAEPYSVAILLDQLDPNGRHTILATDLDEEILKAAAAGVYLERDIKNLPESRRKKYLVPDGEKFAVEPKLKQKVQFKRHNLLADPFPTDLDLILCRNVVIYFTEEAKETLYQRFHRSLRSHGMLFVGGTESLLRAKELGFQSVSPFFYRVVK